MVVFWRYALLCFFLFLLFRDHRDLHVLTHSFPTRRAYDLGAWNLLAGGSPLQRWRWPTGCGNFLGWWVAGWCSSSDWHATRADAPHVRGVMGDGKDRKSTRLNSRH